ncbi:type IV secretory system conjugative DNA transfer family protein [Polaribacter sp.]|uniref:type IV secretory system conjugative DNA transfer family protein n=1 Tax=Polaribacter sp. TaxID=1920175 RepID=UPI003F6B88B8
MIKLILDGLLELLQSLFSGLEELFEKDHQHNAQFGRTGDFLSKRNKGWCVDGLRFADLDTSRRNMAVIAGSGMGKTQTNIFPMILNTKSSMVINDNSSELASTIPYLVSREANTLVMNLIKKQGIYLNPLDGCKGDIAAIRKVVKSIMGSAQEKSDFFSLSGEDCISLFIEHILESEPKIFGNLGNAYRLILEYQANPKAVEYYMAEKASDNVWRKFLALSQNSEKTLKSILATSLSALSWLGENKTLCDLTSVTNINFEDFRRKQTVLFIQSPASDSAFYAKMIALIFQSFYRFAFASLPKEDDLDIKMVLDEFSSLIGGLPDYSQIISNSRKFKIPQCIILQDESLLSPYGELKDNILGNCYLKCYYGGQTKKSLELERLLGSYTYKDKKTDQNKTRPLMYASEIQQMKDEVLVLISGEKPIKTKIKPAYKQSRLRNYLKMESEEDTNPVADYSIQYIDLQPYKDRVANEKK